MIGRRTCLVLSLVGLPVAASIARAQSGQPAPSRLALKGYDPVAYFTDNKAMPGNPQYESTYDGTRYRFASAQHLELFKADPDRYAPQFAGSCAAGIAMGVKVESDPEDWLIVDGKLFVFSSAKTRDSMKADAGGMIAKSQEHWKTLANAPYQ
jgi:YHS domain-containing protein